MVIIPEYIIEKNTKPFISVVVSLKFYIFSWANDSPTDQVNYVLYDHWYKYLSKKFSRLFLITADRIALILNVTDWRTYVQTKGINEEIYLKSINKNHFGNINNLLDINASNLILTIYWLNVIKRKDLWLALIICCKYYLLYRQSVKKYYDNVYLFVGLTNLETFRIFYFSIN